VIALFDFRLLSLSRFLFSTTTSYLAVNAMYCFRLLFALCGFLALLSHLLNARHAPSAPSAQQ
jgi:hypothetical protein